MSLITTAERPPGDVRYRGPRRLGNDAAQDDSDKAGETRAPCRRARGPGGRRRRPGARRVGDRERRGGGEDPAAFERAKESGQLFGSPVAGLPKGLCLENRGSGWAAFGDAHRNGAPLPAGPRDSRREFGAPASGQGLFRICPIYNTGLDE